MLLFHVTTSYQDSAGKQADVIYHAQRAKGPTIEVSLHFLLLAIDTIPETTVREGAPVRVSIFSLAAIHLVLETACRLKSIKHVISLEDRVPSQVSLPSRVSNSSPHAS